MLIYFANVLAFMDFPIQTERLRERELMFKINLHTFLIFQCICFYYELNQCWVNRIEGRLDSIMINDI